MNKPEDVVQMHQRFPIDLVDEMQAAAFMMAGKRDRAVGFEQTKRFIAKAKALSRNINTLIFEIQDHGIDK